MKFFKRNSSTTDTTGTTPSELEPYYEQDGWKLWVRRIVGVIAILLVLAAIVWAAVWVFNAVTDDNTDEAGDTAGSKTEQQETQEQDNTTTEQKPEALPDGQTRPGTDSTDTNGTNENMPSTGDDSDVLPSTGG